MLTRTTEDRSILIWRLLSSPLQSVDMTRSKLAQWKTQALSFNTSAFLKRPHPWLGTFTTAELNPSFLLSFLKICGPSLLESWPRHSQYGLAKCKCISPWHTWCLLCYFSAYLSVFLPGNTIFSIWIFDNIVSLLPLA